MQVLWGARSERTQEAIALPAPSDSSESVSAGTAGGLYCRYAMAVLLDKDSRIHGLKPRTFLTTATPHLGVRTWTCRCRQRLAFLQFRIAA